MSAYGDDPRYHAIKDGRFVCSAPPDAKCRTSPTCECENWCGCDGSPEDAKDNHDGDHCCMTTTKPGAECWMVPWVDAVGLEEAYGPSDLPAAAVWRETGWPDGPVECEWDEGVFWEYAAQDAAGDAGSET